MRKIPMSAWEARQNTLPTNPQAELLADLNEAQRKAVTHGEGPLLVLAGPGTGKTTVIVKRIQYLIQFRQIPPEKILVITFTKDAALSMQKRFAETLSREHIVRDVPFSLSNVNLVSDTNPVSFGTFHSVFYHILLQSDYANRSHFPEILTEASKREIMIPLLRNIRKEISDRYYTGENAAEDAAMMLSAMSFYKNTGNAEAAKKKVNPSWRDLWERVMAQYREKINARGALDFDDMVYECRRVLSENEEERKRWQSRFSHILIDEFQDINPLQYEVLKLLSPKPYSLFAVGDDDQSIYGFRGAGPECMMRFEREFQARKVLLNVNYRSRKEIVDASVAVISENQNRYVKSLEAFRKELELPSDILQGNSGIPSEEFEKKIGILSEQPVTVRCFAEREEQQTYLRESVKAQLKDFPEKSSAVLFRTNLYLQSFAADLKKAGIPFQIRERIRNPYEHFLAKDVTAYLQLAAGIRKRGLILQVMNKPSRYLSRDSLANMGESVEFAQWRKWYQNSTGSHRFEQLAALDEFARQLEVMGKMPLHLAIKYLLHAVGYENYLRRLASEGGENGGNSEEWMAYLEWLTADAKDYTDIHQWLEAQSGLNFKMPEVWEKGKNAPNRNMGVHLMTVHAAKGLEFDRVWLPDCNEKTYPHGSMPDTGQVEEDRRLFYVGMTRAKENLELLGIVGTGERPRFLSRFLSPLKDYCSSESSINSSNSQLSKYSSNASATFSYSSSSSI